MQRRKEREKGVRRGREVMGRLERSCCEERASVASRTRRSGKCFASTNFVSCFAWKKVRKAPGVQS